MMRFAERLADAFAQGEVLSTLRPEDRPADADAAAAIQQDMLDTLGFVACGVRVARAVDGRWIAGPLLEGRIARDGATLPASLFHAPRVSAGILLQAGRDIADAADLPRALSTVRPLLDIASSRYASGPPDAMWQAADLAGLGMITAGKPRRATRAALRAAASGHDLERLLHCAMTTAGFLPAGALIAIATLSDPFPPEPAETLTAEIPGVGQTHITVA